jgi:hypothetical protein
MTGSDVPDLKREKPLSEFGEWDFGRAWASFPFAVEYSVDQYWGSVTDSYRKNFGVVEQISDEGRTSGAVIHKRVLVRGYDAAFSSFLLHILICLLYFNSISLVPVDLEDRLLFFFHLGLTYFETLENENLAQNDRIKECHYYSQRHEFYPWWRFT